MNENTIEQTKKVIDKVFSQATMGICSFETQKKSFWNFFVQFYSKHDGVLYSKPESIFSNPKPDHDSGDFNIPTFQIPNLDLFVEVVDRYLKLAKEFYNDDKEYFELTDDSFTEKLTLDLFVNASNFDFSNPIAYVQQKTKQLQNTIKLEKRTIGKMNENIVSCNIKKNHSNLEGPYDMEISFSNPAYKDVFTLPCITFGMVDDILFLYSIQNKGKKTTKNSEQDNLINENNPTLKKKLDRFFRSVGKDIDMTSIIGNVTPNALVSLTIFLSIMKKEGIKKVVAPSFMPLRYNANLNADKHSYIKKADFSLYGTGCEEVIDLHLKQIEQQHNKIQANITDKFTYTLLRYCHHFDGSRFIYDDIRQQATLSLSNVNSHQDNLLTEIDKICSQSLNLKNCEATNEK